MVRNGRDLRWALSPRGYENWVLWLKRFPNVAIEAIFWGWGVGDSKIDPPRTLPLSGLVLSGGAKG